MCNGCGSTRKRYGYDLESNHYYMTVIEDVRSCCPLKVFVYSVSRQEVLFRYEGKEYKKSRDEFLGSSWRVYNVV